MLLPLTDYSTIVSGKDCCGQVGLLAPSVLARLRIDELGEAVADELRAVLGLLEGLEGADEVGVGRGDHRSCREEGGVIVESTTAALYP